MKRRQLLAGLGTTIAGGSLALGTGAFTSVEASRSVDVSVADDAQAYLSLETPDTSESENYGFTSRNGGAGISIDINDVSGTHDDGEGVGLDSVYEFDNMFQIRNQGTQEVDVSITTLSDDDFDPSASGLTLQFYDGADASTSLDPDDGSSVTLGTGDSVDIGLKVETEDLAIKDFNADATVNAQST